MSNGLRWSKFFWQDWQKDKPLQGCSLAARGLWMEILCLAHDAEPYGHLLLNGKSPTVKQLGSIFGNTSEREVTKLLAELEAAGIFSRMDDGTIYCRRMVRDKVATEFFRSKGKEGGNPLLNGHEHTPPKQRGGLTPPLSQPLSGGLSAVVNPPLILQEAEAEAMYPLFLLLKKYALSKLTILKLGGIMTPLLMV